MDIKPTPPKPKPTPKGVPVAAPRQPDAIIDETKPDTIPTAKRRWYERIGWWWIVIVLVLFALGGGGTWWYLSRAKVVAVTVHKPIVLPKPVTVADPLTGLPVSASQAAQPIIGVMIENLDPDARPQSGLSAAGVVYEALAEGGITRFLAIMQEPLPPSIGPVRSLRPYYLDWGLEYGIPVAHAGGSQPALANVATTHVEDINALLYDGSYFFRTTDRVAPHNLYTNDTLLPQLATKLGFSSAPSFTPRTRKADQPPKGVVPHPTIDIAFSYSDYAVEYRYDAPSNSYARWMAGTPHIDRNTGKQIMVKNVVLEYIPTSYSTQPDGKPETDIADVGSGKAVVFTDGNATVGTWTKTSQSAQTSLTDATGKTIKLNTGNTWFEIVPTINTVTY
jgi:hypothetical protein